MPGRARRSPLILRWFLQEIVDQAALESARYAIKAQLALCRSVVAKYLVAGPSQQGAGIVEAIVGLET